MGPQTEFNRHTVLLSMRNQCHAYPLQAAQSFCRGLSGSVVWCILDCPDNLVYTFSCDLEVCVSSHQLFYQQLVLVCNLDLVKMQLLYPVDNSNKPTVNIHNYYSIIFDQSKSSHSCIFHCSNSPANQTRY